MKPRLNNGGGGGLLQIYKNSDFAYHPMFFTLEGVNEWMDEWMNK